MRGFFLSMLERAIPEDWGFEDTLFLENLENDKMKILQVYLLGNFLSSMSREKIPLKPQIILISPL